MASDPNYSENNLSDIDKLVFLCKKEHGCTHNDIANLVDDGKDHSQEINFAYKKFDLELRVKIMQLYYIANARHVEEFIDVCNEVKIRMLSCVYDLIESKTSMTDIEEASKWIEIQKKEEKTLADLIRFLDFFGNNDYKYLLEFHEALLLKIRESEDRLYAARLADDENKILFDHAFALIVERELNRLQIADREADHEDHNDNFRNLIPFNIDEKQQKIVEAQTNCSICFGDYAPGDDKLVLSCIHVFHYKCISKWKNTCPLCRRDSHGHNRQKH